MKFGKTLQAEAVLEWSTQYVDYKGLKGKLKAVKKSRHNNYENETSATATLRNSNEIQSIDEKEDNNVAASSNPHVPKRFSFTSQHAMSVAESTGSFLNKASAKLMGWKGNRTSFTSSKHKPQPTVLTSLEQLIEQSNPAEHAFFSALNLEITKTTLFYELKEKEAINRLESIKQQYKSLPPKFTKSRKRHTSNTDNSNINDKIHNYEYNDNNNTNSPGERLSISKDLKLKDARKRIKKALFELYRGAELLRNYRNLNRLAFIKILKKFDKIRDINARELYMPKIKSQMKLTNLNKVIREAENFYSKHFEEGSRRRAIKKLRTPYKTNDTHYSSVCKIGLYLGMSLPFLLWIISLALSNSQTVYLQFSNFSLNNDTINKKLENIEHIQDLEYNKANLLIIYSGIGLIIDLAILIGINMYVWSRARINYKLIFGFNPHDNLDYRQYMEIPSLLFLIFCVTMFLNFENQNLFQINVAIYSRVMLALIIFIVIMPFKIFYYNARRWFTLTILRIFGSPFTSVKFREFFICDELTSLSYSLVTLLILTCDCSESCNEQICTSHLSYFSPLLASIPALLRALQCTRRFYDTRKNVHMTNFGKYMSVINAIWMLFLYRRSGGKYKAIWVISQSIYSLYTSYWDACMDWQLFQKNSSNPFLRENLAFKKKWVYYFAIISNCTLRWSWILIFFANKNSINIITFVIAFGEMLRRWQWNFIRVEHEHTLNCRDFRAINDIQLPFGCSPPSNKIIGNDLSGVIIDDNSSKDISKDIIEGETTQIRKSFKTNIQNFFTHMRNSRYIQSGYKDFEADQYEYDEYYDDEYDDDDDEDEYEKHGYEEYVNEFDDEEDSEEYDYDENDYEENDYEENDYDENDYDENDYDEDDYDENDEDGVNEVYVIGNETDPNYPRVNYRRNIPSHLSRSVPMFEED
ncbi:hypothetical protein Glove_34g121 [Diversispora epigaea]|uniref:EXS domain-containing protein n=1 Tax=Diversispora epigaea TaxID=1348612 RepID=A0A397JHH5_9GLOM|nr:hypothetical protein Glove_34g121 [Diversispora epigaea]